MDKNGNFVEVFVMLDFGFNISLFFKSVVGWFGLNGVVICFIMNLVGGKKKSEFFEIIDVMVVLFFDEDIMKIF